MDPWDLDIDIMTYRPVFHVIQTTHVKNIPFYTQTTHNTRFLSGPMTYARNAARVAQSVIIDKNAFMDQKNMDVYEIESFKLKENVVGQALNGRTRNLVQ